MRKALAASILLIAVTPLCAQDGKGILTLFRDSQSSLALKYNDPDRATGFMRWPIFIDGKKVMTLHPGRFVSLVVPSGKHVLSFGHEDSIEIDVQSGKRTFVRPFIAFSKGRIVGETHLAILPCTDALEKGRSTDPMKGKDVDWPDTLTEVRFPTRCE